MAVMPMFPLGSVLLPGGILPLHIFEPRYREMVIDCLRQEGVPEFGQVLITHGREAGGGDERAMIGTVAQMVQIDALDEDRYAVIAVGVRRIEVTTWLPDDPYPKADVVDLPELGAPLNESEATELAIDVAASLGRVRAAIRLAATLGDLDADLAETDVAEDPVIASYHLASLAPIGPADRFRLLAAPGPKARLDLLDDVLDDVEAMLKFRLS